jgi:hypothetical protein
MVKLKDLKTDVWYRVIKGSLSLPKGTIVRPGADQWIEVKGGGWVHEKDKDNAAGKCLFEELEGARMFDDNWEGGE